MSHTLLHSSIKRRYAPNADGYVRVRLADGRVVEEHRVVMARALDRDLEPWEIVRHLNGDRSDNTLSNLMLDARGEEDGKGKRAPRRVSLVCSACGQAFTRRASLVALSIARGQTHFFCSKKCVGKTFGRGKGG